MVKDIILANMFFSFHLNSLGRRNAIVLPIIFDSSGTHISASRNMSLNVTLFMATHFPGSDFSDYSQHFVYS